MDDEIKPLLYCRRPCNPKFHCCLWAARLGPVDKNQTLTQRKLDRALCNIEIWGLGVYLVGVCRVWSFCPSTVSWLYFLLKKSLSSGLADASVSNTARDHDLKEPWLQSTMMAKHNDCKEQWLQRGMTAKKDDCKKTMTAIKQRLQRTVPCKEQFWKEVWSLARKLRFHMFSHLLADFEGSLARKLPWHNFNLQILKETRTNASFSHLQLADFEGSRARKLSFAQLQLAGFEGNSHWKLRFRIFNSQILKDARAKAFLCTTSTCRFWKGSLARKLDQGDKMRRTTDLSLASQ